MRKLDSNAHSVFLLYYHLILVIKYRKKVLNDPISNRAREIFEHIAPNYHITLEEWNHDQDHVHIMFRAHPKSELSKFINAYKSASSRLIKKEYPEVRQKLWKETFWSQSFCLLSAGGAPIEVIRQYIETQGEGKSEHRVPFSDLSNKAQRELFAKTFGCVRLVYNRMLAEKKAHYEKTGKNLSLTPARYKSEFPWLKEVDSLALCNAQLHLQTAYKNFFRDASVGFPKFKSKKKSVKSYTTNYVNGNIVLQNGKLKLPKAGWVRIRQHRKIDECYQLKGATISQEADERYYVALLYSCEEPVHETRKAETAIGLDFSMKELYVDSNGNHATYPHFFQKARQKLAREQRRLSRCEQGSNRYKKQKKKVARIHTRIAHQRKDFLHKESKKIANSYDIVCIENLNMKEMSQDMHLGKSVHDNSWGMFTDFLTYKMERAGKKLIRIDRWYPSSKTCSCCGKVKEDLQLSDRIYECVCGNRMDRDENAAINICREGIRISGMMLDIEKKIS